MKTNAQELFEVIRLVVKNEVAKIVPELVTKHLTEEYLRKIVSESVKNRKPGLQELLSVKDNVDEEETPSPQENTDMGIYNDNNLSKNESRKRSLPKLSEELAHMSYVFEGVKIPGEDGAETPDVKIDALMPDFKNMSRLIEATESKKPMQTSYESKMRELEMRRKALDVPVGS